MEDDRIIEFERNLWVGDDDVYRRCMSDDCLMVVPHEPFLLRGDNAKESNQQTPKWSHVDFTDLQINRAEQGLIVIAYKVEASRGEERYTAYCTSTYRRLGEQDWRVIQHQQTLQPAMHAKAD